MARRNESSLIEDLLKAPWWISAILAVISYFGLKFLVPYILQNRTALYMFILTLIWTGFWDTITDDLPHLISALEEAISRENKN